MKLYKKYSTYKIVVIALEMFFYHTSMNGLAFHAEIMQ